MVIKETDGTAIQTFDNFGQLMSQEFVVGDSCEYYDQNRNVLEEKDPGRHFYAPFDMLESEIYNVYRVTDDGERELVRVCKTREIAEAWKSHYWFQRNQRDDNFDYEIFSFNIETEKPV